MPEQDPKPYRQRNTSGYVLTVPELGREFGPGDEVEHLYPICGFTSVADLADEPDSEQAAAPVPAQQTSKPKRAAKAAGDKDEEGDR